MKRFICIFLVCTLALGVLGGCSKQNEPTPIEPYDIAADTNLPETTTSETTDQVLETTDPVPETTDPVSETTDPVPETTEPVLETTEPVPETTDPVPETTDPVPDSLEELRKILPKTDGSTSTRPLDIAVHCVYYGLKEWEAEKLVNHTKTYTSLSNLMNGECDLILRTPLSDSEREMLERSEFAYTVEPISSEGFVFVVNKDNPVDSLTEEQLRGIYSGQITNWSEVGGNDLPIIAYQRNKDSGSQNYMIEFMGDVPLMKPITEQLPGTMSGILDAVANYENSEGAIGYSVYAYSDGMYEDLAKIKYIKVNGVEPTLEAFADKSYPLIGYNYAIFSSELDEASEVRRLVDWMQSDEGQEVIAAAGYTPYRDIGKLPTLEKLTHYYAKGSGAALEAEVDFAYRMPYLTAGRLPKLADERVDKIVRDYLAKQQARLDAITDEELEAFKSCHYDPHVSIRKLIRLSLVNGYLSVLSGVEYINGWQDSPYFWYGAESAVFDLYTGERLELSDLFPKDSEFVPQLNELLKREAELPYSGFGSTHEMIRDFTGLVEDGFVFTAESIIFKPGETFVDGVELKLTELFGETVISNPRDMEGLFEYEKEGLHGQVIYKTMPSRYSDKLGHAQIYPDSVPDNSYGDITLWLLEPEKSGLSPEVCEKLNSFALELYEKYYTPEAMLDYANKRGEGSELKSCVVGPYADFDWILYGKRYLSFSGPRLLSAAYEDKVVEYYLIDELSEEHYYFTYYFDAKTGELLTLDELLKHGWEEQSYVVPYNPKRYGNPPAEDEKTSASEFFGEIERDSIHIINVWSYDQIPINYDKDPNGSTAIMIRFISDRSTYELYVPYDFAS